MPSPAKTLCYQVLVVDYGNFSAASIPDLRCKMLGPSSDLAIAAVCEEAREVLQEYEGGTVRPPTPKRLTLTQVELPVPVTHTSRAHLSSVS
jgi:hypothetical protein